MKEIEDKIKYWKAEFNEAEATHIVDNIAFCRGMVSGLESALRSIKQPCNTQMHMDKEPCGVCSNGKRNYPGPNFCGFCGRALSQ